MNIPQSWTFKDDEIASNFNTHVKEQLVWYDLVQDLICTISLNYMPFNSTIYDIGASTGNLSNRLKAYIRDRELNYISIDNAKEMQAHFKGCNKLIVADAVTYDYKPFNCAILFLTLMFISEKERVQLFSKLYERLNVGGAIIVVDKEEPIGGNLSTVLHRHMLKTKINQGVMHYNVLEKEFSIIGIQKPISRNFFNKYKKTEIFRFGDFVAYVIEKDF